MRRLAPGGRRRWRRHLRAEDIRRVRFPMLLLVPALPAGALPLGATAMLAPVVPAARAVAVVTQPRPHSEPAHSDDARTVDRPEAPVCNSREPVVTRRGGRGAAGHARGTPRHAKQVPLASVRGVDGVAQGSTPRCASQGQGRPASPRHRRCSRGIRMGGRATAISTGADVRRGP